jgi:hypothetical protein
MTSDPRYWTVVSELNLCLPFSAILSEVHFRPAEWRVEGGLSDRSPVLSSAVQPLTEVLKCG